MFQTRHKRRLLWLAALAIAVCLSLTASVAMARGGMGGGGSGCGGGCGGGGGQPTTPLSEYEIQALNTAIDEEYFAKAVYEKVMATFGPISPFDWITKDEQMHINWVAKLLVKYGHPVPADRWSGKIDLEFISKQQACQIGAQAEFGNAAIYDKMVSRITHGDIISTFGKLRDVSRYRHLPAFQEWAAIYGAAGE